ncbi:FadR/GntR family transcriptional regulator [Micromonospora sp. WMMD882]|uniref:FadR/GntR family transcriptional regulator n=1 Tax=Micromonospora sp. WMMD882 TaxID=3015151 RepID=UPI00248C9993|nr:FadR/GntR family transcriptional regulator [Micromonospora sp. WMMD882]WBB80319.1 FadR/GntR family transcriptional regulator [Micromonospora sp. WMMD882]
MAITDEAIEKIKAMILSGELRPGDRLPVEKALAQRLGLSRNSLREAIRALSVLRVLETRQGAGTFVTSLAPGLVLDAVSFIVNFHDPHTAIDFLEVRRVLEAEAAARAATRITPTQIAELRALNERIHALASDDPLDTEQLVTVDRQFHATIAAASGNLALAALTDMLGGQTAPARSLRLAVHASTAASAVTEHHDIIAALAAGNAEHARLRAAVHILNVEDWLRQEIDDTEPGDARTVGVGDTGSTSDRPAATRTLVTPAGGDVRPPTPVRPAPRQT